MELRVLCPRFRMENNDPIARPEAQRVSMGVYYGSHRAQRWIKVIKGWKHYIFESIAPQSRGNALAGCLKSPAKATPTDLLQLFPDIVHHQDGAESGNLLFWASAEDICNASSVSHDDWGSLLIVCRWICFINGWDVLICWWKLATNVLSMDKDWAKNIKEENLSKRKTACCYYHFFCFFFPFYCF